ncbi:T9SS type A sorting domain-containing protein [Flavobacterium sp.]|uniref:T9SS type A sorting domain-containing protein n=1 Tax=Flavobacterium sp. TaxID=239 RepID=UPI00375038F6
MKKLLLLLLTFSSLSTFAQDECATAIPITANGTTTAPAITGVFVSGCYTHTFDNTGTGPINGLWYSFTPTTSGEVVISSDLAANVAPNSNDTKVSVFTGTCGSLTCLASNDDVSATNYLSTISFPVAPGTTYYIQWDNYWLSAGFNFDLTFTSIPCNKVYTFSKPTNITTTSVTLNWTASVSSPAQYEVEYGALGFTPGSGTVLLTPTNSISISGLTASANYDYYVKSKCDATTSSTASAVQTFSLAKTCPYANGFDNNGQLAGWTTSGNGVGGYGLSVIANAANSQSPSFYWIFNTATTGAVNNWIYSAPIFLTAGESVTTSFWVRCASARSFRLTVGNNNTSAAQTSVIWSNTALLASTYAQQTTTAYVAPSTGIYYFAFNDISAATTAVATLRLDTINFTSVLSTNEFLNSKFSVYPNPTSGIVTVSSNDIAINNIQITDINGRTVKNINANGVNESQINISELSQGIYLMKIVSEQGSVTKKIVKE